MAKAYSAFGLLLLIELFAQFYFIAAAVIPIAAPLTVAFPPDNASYNTFSALHGLNGTLLIPSTILILILLSFTARHPWKTTLFTALLLLLLILQFASPSSAFSILNSPHRRPPWPQRPAHCRPRPPANLAEVGF